MRRSAHLRARRGKLLARRDSLRVDLESVEEKLRAVEVELGERPPIRPDLTQLTLEEVEFPFYDAEFGTFGPEMREAVWRLSMINESSHAGLVVGSLAYAAVSVLFEARAPLHVDEIVRQLQGKGIEGSKGSLMVALGRLHNEGKAVIRTAPNTFALLPAEPVRAAKCRRA
jgi:hypothetical protein